MIALDALQLVALEEGILSDERDYPSGRDFWKAVDALRNRGATIPTFAQDESPISPTDGALDPTATPSKSTVLRILNRGENVRFYVHTYDREYHERVALDIAPVIFDLTEELRLPPAVAYRTAELFVKAQDADIITGGSNERTLAAGVRIATIEADVPRPLDFIAEVVNEDPNSVRHKMHRLLRETDLSENISASQLLVSGADYVPFMAELLDYEDDDELITKVRERLSKIEKPGGVSPWSAAAGAFYAILKQSSRYQTTQSEIANSVGVSKVTIRNNYRRYLQ